MIRVDEYAQLSSHTYDRRFDDNKMTMPEGFKRITWQDDDLKTGFSAGSYVRGNEIVIAFTGTNESHTKDFINANIPAATGVWSWQVKHAIDFTMNIINSPIFEGKNLTFTGHSLGGGLASLMGIFFDKETFVFDSAPFKNLITSNQSLAMVDFIVKHSNYQYDPLVNAITMIPGKKPEDTIFVSDYHNRKGNIKSWYLSGEALEYARSFFPVVGDGLQETAVDIGLQSIDYAQNLPDKLASTVIRHSMVLLQAALRSDEFRVALSKVPVALQVIFEKNLYSAGNPEYDPFPDLL